MGFRLNAKPHIVSKVTWNVDGVNNTSRSEATEVVIYLLLPKEP